MTLIMLKAHAFVIRKRRAFKLSLEMLSLGGSEVIPINCLTGPSSLLLSLFILFTLYMVLSYGVMNTIPHP
jgi:hypothetical protein